MTISLVGLWNNHEICLFQKKKITNFINLRRENFLSESIKKCGFYWSGTKKRKKKYAFFSQWRAEKGQISSIFQGKITNLVYHTKKNCKFCQSVIEKILNFVDESKKKFVDQFQKNHEFLFISLRKIMNFVNQVLKNLKFCQSGVEQSHFFFAIWQQHTVFEYLYNLTHKMFNLL